MQPTSDSEDRIDRAQWDLELIESNVADDAVEQRVSDARVNIRAALSQPAASEDYLATARKLLRDDVMPALDPDGPLYPYARNAYEALEAEQ